MQFEIKPYIGVGPIKFGMHRDEVRKILSSPFKEFVKWAAASTIPTDDFYNLNFHVYYNKNSNCKGIEFAKGSNAIFQGHEIVGRPFSEVMEWLIKLDSSARLDDDSGVKSEQLSIDLWVPDADDDVNSLIESIYVFAKKD